MEFLLTYLLFLLKGVTIVVLLMVFLAFVAAMKSKEKLSPIQFDYLNDKQQALEKSLLEKFAKLGTKAALAALKQFAQGIKSRKRLNKQMAKQRKRCFVL